MWQSLALALSVLFLVPPGGWTAPEPAIGLVIRGVDVALNDIPAVVGTTVFSGDKITTGRQGWVLILLENGDYFSLGDGVSQAVVQRVSDRDLFVNLSMGVLTLVTPKEALFRVQTPCATVLPTDPRDSMWQVVVFDQRTVEVEAYRNSVRADVGSGEVTVRPRERVRITCGEPGVPPRVVWIGMTVLGGTLGALGIILSQLERSQPPIPASPSGFP